MNDEKRTQPQKTTSTQGEQPPFPVPALGGSQDVHQQPPPIYPLVAPTHGVPGQQDAAAIGVQYQAELFARCARGEHELTTKYGMCGIITAICCFPCGLLCLFSDAEKVCARCGVKVEK